MNKNHIRWSKDSYGFNYRFNSLHHTLTYRVKLRLAATKKFNTPDTFKYNETLNIQLIDFLKTYKLAKIAKTFIVDGQKPSYTSSTNLRGFKESTIKTSNQGSYNLLTSFSSLKNNSNGRVTYNRLKEFIKSGNSNKFDFSQLNVNVQQNKFNDFIINKEIPLSLTSTRNSSAQTTAFAVDGLWPSEFKTSPALETTNSLLKNKNFTTPKKDSNKLLLNQVVTGVAVKQKSRTYRFLQTILVKYLDTTPNTLKKNKLLVQSSNDFNFNKSLVSSSIKNKVYHGFRRRWPKVIQEFNTSPERIESQSNVLFNNRDQYFLFSKINQKSFLAYWLIPVAGLALLTPKMYGSSNFHAPQRNLFIEQALTYHGENRREPQMILQDGVSRMRYGASRLDGQRPSSHPLAIEGMIHSRSNVTLSEGYWYEDYLQSLNNLHTFLNAKKFFSLNMNLPLWSSGISKKPLSETTHIRTKAGFTKGWSPFPSVQFLNDSLSRLPFKSNLSAAAEYKVSNVNKILFQERLNHVPRNHVYNSNSMLYLTSMSPFYSTTLLNNNLNFVTTNNTLKLLNLKLLQSSNVGSLNDTSSLRKSAFTGRLLQVVNPFSSYHEALKLINLNLKRSVLTFSSNKNSVDQRWSLALKAMPWLANGESFEFAKQKGINGFAYKILYKQWFPSIEVVNPESRVSTRTSMPSKNNYTALRVDGQKPSKFLNNFQANKNNLLLHYFLFNNKTITKYSREKQNFITGPLKLKINLLQTVVSNKLNTRWPKAIYGENREISTSSEILNLSDSTVSAVNTKRGSLKFGFSMPKGQLTLNSNLMDATGYGDYALSNNFGIEAAKHLQRKKYKHGLNLYFNFIKNKFRTYIRFNTIDSFNRIINKRKSPKMQQASLDDIYLLRKQTLHPMYGESRGNVQEKTRSTAVKKQFLETVLLSKQFFNSPSLVFKHQKMFKNQSEEVVARLHLQKKRKAKKQRLETRRQKKRMRFFPRPIWLRYRMFLNFVNQRNLNNRHPSLNGLPVPFVEHQLSVPTDHGKSRRWPKNDIYLLPKQASYFLDAKHPFASESNSGLQMLQKDKEFNRANVSFQTLKWHIVRTGSYYKGSAFKFQRANLSFARKLAARQLVSIEDAIRTHFSIFNKTKSLKLVRWPKAIYGESRGQLALTTGIQKQKTKLRDIKIKANYVNFKNQKTNNPPSPTDKDKDKDTIFRDFWIWAYNNTSPNNYNKSLWCLLPNNTSPLVFNQFNPSDPDRESKQLKNAFAIARIYWALNKTNSNSFTDYNKRYNLWGTQKLRNQSKNNKTKYLEKQFLTNWEKFFLNKKLNGFYKKISSKINQKTQKLKYLTSYEDSILSSPKNIKMFNTAWWSNLNIKPLLTDILDGQRPSKDARSPKAIEASTAKAVVTKKIDFKIFDNKWSEMNSTVLISSTVLLHFCALISLVSISQVRCFLKFHLILLYKLSNVYNSLITKISGMLPQITTAQGVDGQRPSKQKTRLDIHKFQQQDLRLRFLDKATAPQQEIADGNFIAKGLDQGPKAVDGESRGEPKNRSLLSPSKPVTNQKKLLTYFSINLLKKEFSNIRDSLSLLNRDLKSFSTPQLFTQQTVTLKNQSTKLSFGLNNSNVATAADTKVTFQLRSKFNIISQKSAFLKRTSFLTPVNKKSETSWLEYSYKIQRTKLNSKKTANVLLKFSKNSILKVVFNTIDLFQSAVRSISSFFEKPAELTTTWIAYGFLVEWSSDLITIIPENVDIYMWNVFSKMTRTTPLALILNSHLLAPPFTSVFNGYLGSLTIGKELNGTTSLVGVLNNANAFSYTAGAVLKYPAVLTLSHLLHRRILYLFDTFFETISQPDSDLIRRQQKGTLFWDMWADFIVTAADYYNVNVAALSTIKAEQNNLIEKISNDSSNVFWSKTRSSFNYRESNEPPLNRVLKNSENITFSSLANLQRWSVNQYITYQSWHSHNGSNNSNGDLFIDYHPPKSFAHIPAIKYNSILQQPIGTLVCQIYSGIFNKQISKNVLLVNTKTTTKNVSTDYNILLIQALAGETELKIITDNANRYALINRGFAIGIKLLRDVFDAIALNTPCIFLLEDIHAIGERRPMLISDYGGAMADDNGSFKEDFFGGQRDEVHEKNQVIYQLTRHAITHYKKPFKGDYSLAIPTNLYVTDLFLKTRAQSTSNLSLIEKHNVTIKNKIQIKPANDSSAQQSSANQALQTINKDSHLQISQRKSNFAPPSTSPFTVLLLKEEKKLKPNKIVEEFPWTGLPGEQLATKPRTSYSVRAKVAMLAELALSNLSAKLDMITDLLVIIDSVRSNKGFVVFATTDVPHVLDPALRRPGRLDETICMPNNNSDLLSRSNYEIIKSVKPLTNIDLTNYFAQTPSSALTVNFKDFNTILGLMNKLPIAKHSQNSSLNYALISHAKNLQRKSVIQKDAAYGNVFGYTKTTTAKAVDGQRPSKDARWPKTIEASSKQVLERNVVQKKNKYKAIAYYEVGKVLLSHYLTLHSFDGQKPSTAKPVKRQLSPADSLNLKSINFLSLYGSKNKIIMQLMLLFGGKISQLLSSKKSKRSSNINFSGGLTNMYSKTPNVLNFDMSQLFESTSNLQIATSIMLAFLHKRYLYRKNLIVPKLLSFIDGNVLDEPPSPPFSSLLIPAKRFENYKRVFRDSIFGEKMGQRKAEISLAEKLQYHMQLRSIKLLNKTNTNNLMLQEQEQSPNAVDRNLVGNNSSLLDGLSRFSADKSLQTTTNINWYYKNRILKRHGQYLTNQWWNGQLSEHNAETVFLSDIDWRSSFIKNKQMNVIKFKKLYNLPPQRTRSDSLDVLLDFPDTDQYYNPRRRRWLLNKGYWSFWFNFDKVYSEEIISTWILESIIQTYTYLHNNTELLDFITNKYISLGYANTDAFGCSSVPTLQNNDIALRLKTELSSVKEIILTNSFKRF